MSVAVRRRKSISFVVQTLRERHSANVRGVGLCIIDQYHMTRCGAPSVGRYRLSIAVVKTARANADVDQNGSGVWMRSSVPTIQSSSHHRWFRSCYLLNYRAMHGKPVSVTFTTLPRTPRKRKR